jgi:protein-S-isoprenylcysteine O-methyltransferase Ste14
MRALELKVPPPVVALLVAAAMWGFSLATSPIEIPALIRAVAGIALAIAGSGIAVSGIIAFRRAGTTVNPLKPETSSALVTSGIYQYTRNPMYVGLALVLLGWAAFLCAVAALAGPVIFVLYINRFQIAPEERALATLFGAAFAGYRARVRQWL